MPEREYDEHEQGIINEFEYNVYERTGTMPSPEVVSDFMQFRDEVKETVESGNVDNIMELFWDIATDEILNPEFQSDAVAAVAENGTINDLREMLEPCFPVSFDPILEPEQYLSDTPKDAVGAICNAIKEAVESDKFSGNFNVFHLNDALGVVSNNMHLSDGAKDTLSKILITEEVYNPDFSQICEGLDYLARNGDFNGTLDEMSVTSDHLQSKNLPEGVNEQISDLFGSLETAYIEVENDAIFDGIKDTIENHPDEIEKMDFWGGEGIIDLNYAIDHAFPDERYCDERLLDIRDVVREFRYIDGEIETREEAIEKITELLDEYQEENGPTDIETAEETITVGGETFTSSDFSVDEDDMEALSDAFTVSDTDFEGLAQMADAQEDLDINGADTGDMGNTDISENDDIPGVDAEDDTGSVDDNGSDPVD